MSGTRRIFLNQAAALLWGFSLFGYVYGQTKARASIEDVIRELEAGAALLRDKQYPHMDIVSAYLSEARQPAKWSGSIEVGATVGQLQKYRQLNGSVVFGTIPDRFIQSINSSQDKQMLLMCIVVREAWGLHLMRSRSFNTTMMAAHFLEVVRQMDLQIVETLPNGHASYNETGILGLGHQIVDLWSDLFVCEIYEAINVEHFKAWTVAASRGLDVASTDAVIKGEFAKFYGLYAPLIDNHDSGNLGIRIWSAYVVLNAVRLRAGVISAIDGAVAMDMPIIASKLVNLQRQLG